MILFQVLSFFLGVIALLYAGGVMVRTLTTVARFLGVGEFVLSFILVAFATSLPELLVGVTSALKGAPALSLGNVVGANVLNLTLVLGVSAIIAGALSLSNLGKRDEFQMTLGMLLVPLVLLLDGYLGRQEGFLLLFLFAGYLLYLVQAEKSPKIPVDGEKISMGRFFKNAGAFLLAAALLLASSQFVVGSGVALAGLFDLPVFFVGILVAIGTTLPEIVFGVRSVFLGHRAMALGNVLGSIIVNVSLILGVVAAIEPILVAEPIRPLFGLSLAVVLLLLLQVLAGTKEYLSRFWGIILTVIAIIFIAVEGLL